MIGSWRFERDLLATVLLLGAGLDSFWIQVGVIIRPDSDSTLIPIWLACLWLMFAMTLNHSLKWFKSHKLIAIPLGGIAGSICYTAGTNLTELSLSPNGIGFIFLGWSILFPIFLIFAEFYEQKAKKHLQV